MEKQPDDETHPSIPKVAAAVDAQPAHSVSSPETKQKDAFHSSFLVKLFVVVLLLHFCGRYLKNHSGLTEDEKKGYQQQRGNGHNAELIDLINKEEAERESRNKPATMPAR